MLFPLLFSLVVSLPPAPVRFDSVSVSVPAAIPKAKFCQFHLLLKARHFYCRGELNEVFQLLLLFLLSFPSACTSSYTLPAGRWEMVVSQIQYSLSVAFWLSFLLLWPSFSWGWANYSWLGLAGQHGLPSLLSSFLADFSVTAEDQVVGHTNLKYACGPHQIFLWCDRCDLHFFSYDGQKPLHDREKPRHASPPSCSRSSVFKEEVIFTLIHYWAPEFCKSLISTLKGTTLSTDQGSCCAPW